MATRVSFQICSCHSCVYKPLVAAHCLPEESPEPHIQGPPAWAAHGPMAPRTMEPPQTRHARSNSPELPSAGPPAGGTCFSVLLQLKSHLLRAAASSSQGTLHTPPSLSPYSVTYGSVLHYLPFSPDSASEGQEIHLIHLIFTILGTGPDTMWTLNKYLWNKLVSVSGVAFQTLLDCP